MAGKEKDGASWIRLSGIGVEFAAAVAGLTLVGYWVGRHWNCNPWGVLIGAMLGLIGGMYNLIRKSLAAVREPEHHLHFRADRRGV